MLKGLISFGFPLNNGFVPPLPKVEPILYLPGSNAFISPLFLAL